MNRWRALGAAAGAGISAAAAGLVWTQVERRSPTLRRYTVEVDLPSDVRPLRILQIADPHFYAGQEFLVDYVRDLASLDFDLVISTGDNLGSVDGLDLLADAFEPLLRRPGVFVLGSNDYYSPRRKNWASYLRKGAKKEPKRTDKDLPWFEMTKMFTDAGWIDLTNQSEIIELPLFDEGVPCSGSEGVPASRTVGSWGSARSGDGSQAPLPSSGEVKIRRAQRVGFVGVDDPHIGRDHIPQVPDNWDDSRMYRLGVTHAPYQRILNEYVSLGVHAIFAGHTHGGQLCVPGYGALVTNSDLPRAYASGMHTWGFGGDSAALHVSAGLGNSPFAPVRFACRPEASLVTLKPRS
ncbi:MAG: metallophosphoesterase [Actinomycetaceae bacterium]|nr:metallophosphoesterase [Actinomycetaceae bacterium]